MSDRPPNLRMWGAWPNVDDMPMEDVAKDQREEAAMSGVHPSHKTRFSDASSFDEVCVKCGATDILNGGWGELANPCSKEHSEEERWATPSSPSEAEKVLNRLDAYVEKLTGVLEHGDPDRGGNIHYWDLRIAIREAASLLRKQEEEKRAYEQVEWHNKNLLAQLEKQAERIREIDRHEQTLRDNGIEGHGQAIAAILDLLAQLAAAQEELKFAHGFMLEHGHHTDACWNREPRKGCICGFEKKADRLSRAALAEEEKGNDG